MQQQSALYAQSNAASSPPRVKCTHLGCGWVKFTHVHDGTPLSRQYSAHVVMFGADSCHGSWQPPTVSFLSGGHTHVPSWSEPFVAVHRSAVTVTHPAPPRIALPAG